MQISAEVITLLGTFIASTLIYIITSWIQQRNKRSFTLRLIGSIYRPLHYFLNLRYIGLMTFAALASTTFSIFLTILPSEISKHYFIYQIISFTSYFITLILIIILAIFWGMRKKIITSLVQESSVHNSPDIDSLPSKINRILYGFFILEARYLILIIALFIIFAIIFSVLDKNFAPIGFVLIKASMLTIFVILSIYEFSSRIVRLNISFFDTDAEIESSLFNLIKDPSFCVCIIDNLKNKYCGNLEGISYGVLIRLENSDKTVNIPYESIYEVTSCDSNNNNKPKLPLIF